MQIAFFDFDGTITTEDSLIKFIRFAVGDIQFIFGLVAMSPFLLMYKFNLIPNHKAKAMLLQYFFKGMPEQKFKSLAKQFSLEHLSKILLPKAMEKITWHKEQGHKVVIVSASIECWLKPWCEKNNLELIATRLEFLNNKVTGKFLTANCYGPEKVRRIHEQYDINSFDIIYAYGDSNGDRELLAMADKPYLKPF